MFQLRRSAFRILSLPSTSSASRSRSIASLSRSTLSKPSRLSVISYQRRWASDEAEKTETPRVKKVDPAPEDEVEDAIKENATAEEVTEASKSAPEEPKSSIRAAAGKVSDAVADAAQTAKSFATSTESVPAAGAPTPSDADEAVEPRPTIPPSEAVYIGNLFFDVTQEDLEREFSHFGQVMDTKIIRDARGLSKGYGFVRYSTIDAATKALETMGGAVFEGRRINVQYAARHLAKEPKLDRSGRVLNSPSKTLYIGNISFDVTDRELNELFRGLKNIIDVRVAIDRRTGQPKGFAHADFIDIQSAMNAFETLNGMMAFGRPLRVDYSHPHKRSTAGSGGSQAQSLDSPF